MACWRQRTRERERDREREHEIEREIRLQHTREKKNSGAEDVAGEVVMPDLNGA